MSQMLNCARPVTRAAAEAVYADLKPLLRRMVRAQSLRADPADADAAFFFLEAYITHDPVRGPLVPRVRYRVWDGLIRTRRREAARAARVEAGFDPDWTPAPPAPGPARMGEVTARMTLDAQKLVALLFEPPPELDAAIRGAATPGPASIRVLLRRHAHRAWGWPRARIDAAFFSVSAAL